MRRSDAGSFGPSAPPANPYASPADQYHGPGGAGGQYYAPNDADTTTKPGLFSRLFKGRHAAMKTNPNDMLPSHTPPGMEQTTATYATYETNHVAYETTPTPHTPDIMTTHQQSSWSPVYHGDAATSTSPTTQPPAYGYASDLHSNSNPYAGDSYHQNQATALPYPSSPTSAYRQPEQQVSSSSPYEPMRRNEYTPPPRDYQYTDGLYDRR